ncbi:hypothetical protein PIROE2DRAFT_16921, partial [Piromyces sp. E2]
IDIKGKEIKSNYFPESVQALLSQSSKNVKSLDDEKASYLLNKYTKNLLRKPKETVSVPTESKYTIASSSSSSSSSIPQPSISVTESTRKPYQFTAGNLSYSMNKENINQSTYDTDTDYQSTPSGSSSTLSSRHSASRLKYPMSFNKKRTPLSEIKPTNNKNVEDQTSTLKPPPKSVTKESEQSTSQASTSNESTKKKPDLQSSKENSCYNSTYVSKINASIPVSLQTQTPPPKKSVASLISDIDSISPLSLSPLSSCKDELMRQFTNSTTSDEQNADNERNSIDDKTILNTFTVAFDNISSLSTKIDLLTEIMDKNEERQQQQYNTDMNQINFELFEIKQKVSQSMKRLQQEFDPILNALKDKAEHSEHSEHSEHPEHPEHPEEKKEEQTNSKAVIKSEENKTLSLGSPIISNEDNDRIQQDLGLMKSQLVNLTNENQILKAGNLSNRNSRKKLCHTLHFFCTSLDDSNVESNDGLSQ